MRDFLISLRILGFSITNFFWEIHNKIGKLEIDKLRTIPKLEIIDALDMFHLAYPHNVGLGERKLVNLPHWFLEIIEEQVFESYRVRNVSSEAVVMYHGQEVYPVVCRDSNRSGYEVIIAFLYSIQEIMLNF